VYRAHLHPRPQQRNCRDHKHSHSHQYHHQRPPKQPRRTCSPRTLPRSIHKRPSRRFHRVGLSAHSRCTSFAPCALPRTLATNARSSKHSRRGRISL
jgi:hypothetical protein